MFRFLLQSRDGAPVDPPAFVTVEPIWFVDDTFTTGRGATWRIVEIETEIDEELIEQGFNGVFTVEPSGD